MARCRRSWTAGLATAVALGGLASATAQSPFSTEFAAALADSELANAVDAAPATVPPKADVSDVTPNGAPAVYVRSTATRPAEAAGQTVFVRPQSAAWIAVAGAFRNLGCYELPAGSISIGELTSRCGGMTPEASGRIRIIRRGESAGTTTNPADRVMPGDLVIAERHGAAISGDLPSRPDRELGIVGLTERPLVVRVPVEIATVDGMLHLTGQTHLSPADLVVLVDGQHKRRGNETDTLSDSSVLVFDPLRVDAQAVASHPPQTNFYAADASNPSATIRRVAAIDAPVHSEPALMSPVDEQAGEVSSPAIALAPPSANVAATPVDDDLTPLEPVEMLDPPAGDSSMSLPRLADRSGSITVGQPEAESHIVPVPEDVFYPEISTPAAPAQPQEPQASNAAATTPPVAVRPDFDEPLMTVEPIDLSKADDAETEEGLAFDDLWPTLLIGAVLGVMTFLTIRWIRSRTAKDSASQKRSGSSPATIPFEPQLVQRDRATSDDDVVPTPMDSDLFASLVADRLAYREETVVLPMSMRLHGRSTALTNLRVDVPAGDVPTMHVPSEGQAASHPVDQAHSSDSSSDARTAGGERRRVDSAPGKPSTEIVLLGGTPFERALAARQQGKRRDGH